MLAYYPNSANISQFSNDLISKLSKLPNSLYLPKPNTRPPHDQTPFRPAVFSDSLIAFWLAYTHKLSHSQFRYSIFRDFQAAKSGATRSPLYDDQD